MHFLGLVCSFWLSVCLSVCLSFSSLHLDINTPGISFGMQHLYNNAWMCPYLWKFRWCARQCKFLVNQTYFSLSSNRVRTSCVWKQNGVAVECERNNSTLKRVVSLLVIWKAGHLYFEIGTWWHIPDDRPSCGVYFYVQIYCLTVQPYRSSSILKLCCNQAGFAK